MTTPRVPIISLITQRTRLVGRTLDDVVKEVVEGGVNHVQLREKDLDGRDLLILAEWIREIIGQRAVFVVNDRVDVALACGADGVHLPETGLPTRAVRKLMGPDRLIARSVHSVKDAVRAERDGADYVQLGPVFETASHPGQQPLGLKAIEVAHGELNIPIIAVGGINRHNAAEVMRSGATGIAVISALMDAENHLSAAQELQAAIMAEVEKK